LFNTFAKNKLLMRYTFSLAFLIPLVISINSCKSSKPVASSPSAALSAEDYIYTYKDLAVSEMKRTGVPASITLAQGMIESDFGRSRLAREGNNHFGIKCHSEWTGPTISHNDDRRNECFRKYRKVEESYYDHSDFLRSGSRYEFLFDLKPTDYKGWARGLKKAGYATNPDYADMVIRKIEENNLMNLDRGYNPAPVSQSVTKPVNSKILAPDTDTSAIGMVVNNGTLQVAARVPRIMENNRIQYIIVKDGDTREKIESEFQLLKWELPRYNELNTDFKPVPGQILYLQPKREKAEAGKDFYTTVEGDTMYLVSQKFGIKVKDLYEMNRMESGSEPGAGKKIWLRSLKPVN
jgi:LysM repeat protein